MAALLHHEEYMISGGLRVNAFNHPWIYKVSHAFPPHLLVPLVLSRCLTEHITGQYRLITLIAPFWMEASWLSTVLNLLDDIPHHCLIIKYFVRDVLHSSGVQGSAIATFNPLADMCRTDKSFLPQCVRQCEGD